MAACFIVSSPHASFNLFGARSLFFSFLAECALKDAALIGAHRGRHGGPPLEVGVGGDTWAHLHTGGARLSCGMTFQRHAPAVELLLPTACSPWSASPEPHPPAPRACQTYPRRRGSALAPRLVGRPEAVVPKQHLHCAPLPPCCGSRRRLATSPPWARRALRLGGCPRGCCPRPQSSFLTACTPTLLLWPQATLDDITFLSASAGHAGAGVPEQFLTAWLPFLL